MFGHLKVSILKTILVLRFSQILWNVEFRYKQTYKQSLKYKIRKTGKLTIEYKVSSSKTQKWSQNVRSIYTWWLIFKAKSLVRYVGNLGGPSRTLCTAKCASMRISLLSKCTRVLEVPFWGNAPSCLYRYPHRWSLSGARAQFLRLMRISSTALLDVEFSSHAWHQLDFDQLRNS